MTPENIREWRNEKKKKKNRGRRKRERKGGRKIGEGGRKGRREKIKKEGKKRKIVFQPVPLWTTRAVSCRPGG